MKRIIIYITTLILLSSCEKTEESDNIQKKNYILEIFKDNQLISDYEYNEEYKIVRNNRYKNDTLYYYSVYNYDNEGRLVRIDWPKIYEVYYIYEYNDNKNRVVNKKTYDINSNELKSTTTFEYNEDSLHMNKHYSRENRLLYEIEFLFDSNGNTIKKSRQFSNEDNYYIREMKYDNMNSVYLHSNYITGTPVSLNNTIELSSTTKLENYRSIFEYNQDKYPIKEVRIYTEKLDTSIYEFKYLTDN